MPRGVANLFFFDGEQIEAFAESDVSQELVRTAVSGLLGLDLVDRLQDDLTVLERRHRQDAAEGEDRNVITARQQDLQRIRSREQDLMQQVQMAERDLTVAIGKASQARTRLQREGMQQYEQRDETTARLHNARAAAKAVRTGLIDAVAGFGPLLLVPDLLAAAHIQARAEREHADNATLAHLLALRDNELLNFFLGSQQASAKVRAAAEQFLLEDRKARHAGAYVEPLLGPDEHTLGLAGQLLDGQLNAVRDDLRQRVKDLEKARVALEAAERAAAAIPDTDVGDAMVAEYEKANEAVASCVLASTF